MKVLSVGFGHIGRAVAHRFADAGHHVTAISRSAKVSDHAHIRHVVGDARDQLSYESARSAMAGEPDLLVVILTPQRGSGEAGYQQAFVETAHAICEFAQALSALPDIIFVSSTSVYGENEGGWCDEHTLEHPVRYNGRLLLKAETIYRDVFAEKLSVVRPSGIYGLNRLRLINLINKGKPVSPLHWSNRIFDTDLVNIIDQVAQLPSAERQPLYIATDTQPNLLVDVLDHLADCLEKPRLPRFESAPISGKRLQSCYVQDDWLTYPSWQAGYDAVLAHLLK